jgi:integrase
MVNSLIDILSELLGWLSIVWVGGLAVVFSLLVLFFRLNNEDAQHGAKILKFMPWVPFRWQHTNSPARFSIPQPQSSSPDWRNIAIALKTPSLQVSTVNSSLRVLRRMLRLAVEWGELESAPTIKRLPGERHREHVVSHDEEARYLDAGSELLASIATVLIDTGMRPEECNRVRWESITWVNGRNGTLFVTHGKTAAARRMLPMTPRVRAILENRWKRMGKPVEGWI